MKYYIIAGERSGDLHASNLIKELRKNDPQAEFRAWGGDMMKNQGAVIVKHIDELAFMGFVEVVRNLPAIMKNFRLCKNDILNYKPDAIIFIDYPGFNLRIAQFAKQNKHTYHLLHFSTGLGMAQIEGKKDQKGY
jgi:lipid-A-disaccharide synthase